MGASVSRTITTRRPLSSVARVTLVACAALAVGASAAKAACVPPATRPRPSRTPSASGASLPCFFIDDSSRTDGKDGARQLGSAQNCPMLTVSGSGSGADDARFRFQHHAETRVHAFAHALRQRPQLLAAGVAMVDQYQRVPVRNAGVAFACALEAAGLD